MNLKVDGFGHDDNRKIKRPEVKFNNFNNCYQQLKTGKPIIGNMLNGSVNQTNDTTQTAFQG